MTRALVMDFANDKKALDINDEYMFGKSILVCPVTSPMYSKDIRRKISALLNQRKSTCLQEQNGMTSGPEKSKTADKP